MTWPEMNILWDNTSRSYMYHGFKSAHSIHQIVTVIVIMVAIVNALWKVAIKWNTIQLIQAIW